MVQYRIKRKDCDCHPETCGHWMYNAEILVEGEWIGIHISEDYSWLVKQRIEQNYPDWRLYEPK